MSLADSVAMETTVSLIKQMVMPNQGQEWQEIVAEEIQARFSRRANEIRNLKSEIFYLQKECDVLKEMLRLETNKVQEENGLLDSSRLTVIPTANGLTITVQEAASFQFKDAVLTIHL